MSLVSDFCFCFPFNLPSYPFIDGQAIPLGWEEVLEELAAEILDDPAPKRSELEEL